MDPETRFREVFELAYAPLCRYARHRGLTGPDAEDLVAQTMEIAWRRISDMPATEPLPWLYAVAHNVWRNTARRDRRRRELLARFGMRSPDEARHDPGGLEPGALRAALASLSDDDQEILRLVAWDGLAPAEIAVVLPTNPRTLLDYIYAQTAGEGQALGRNGEAFVTIGDLLREAIAPPAVSAALYRAAALIPGVTVAPDAADAIDRHGVAVAFTYQGVRTEWIFSKQTFQYLGELDISTANGSITGEDAVLQRAFVDHTGQAPG